MCATTHRALLLQIFLVTIVFSTRLAATSYGYLVGYAVQEGSSVCSLSPVPITQAPLFSPYNRNNQQWWANLVEEAAFSNVPFIALNFRGDSPCGKVPPAGSEPTSYATNLVNAINQRGYSAFLKVALFDDTGSYQPQLKLCTNSNAPFDMGNSTLWADYIWNTRWKPFFERVGDSNRMKVNGRPLVFMWSAADGLGITNQQGNLRRLISYLRSQTQTTFGFDPWIIVDQSWLTEDTTVGPQVEGVNNWFNPDPAAPLKSWTKKTHIGRGGSFTTGIVTPGFWYPRTGQSDLFLDRNSGQTLRDGLQGTLGSHVVLMEGLTDIEEAAGYFRGSTLCIPGCGSPVPPSGQCWTHANQYVNTVREYSAPDARYVVYEAEAADVYQTFNTTQSTLYRRTGTLPIFYTGTAKDNWAVQMKSGDWLEFSDFELGSASIYKLKVRYSSVSGGGGQLKVDGVTKATFSLGPTGSVSSYVEVSVTPQFTITSANHDVRFQVTSGDVRIDWWLLNGLF